MSIISRKTAVKLVAYFILATLVVGALELASFLYLNISGRYEPDPDKRWAFTSNAFWAEFEGECTYAMSMYPHPYLGFVHHRTPPCEKLWINNIGLFGRDVPPRPDSTAYVVALLGASVASQLGQEQSGAPLYLEEELNKCYRPPHGDHFIVLNIADGAWKQTQETIAAVLFGDIADAFVSLGGVMEYYTLVGPWYKFDYPASNFEIVNPIATGDFEGVVAGLVVYKLSTFAKSNWILRHSSLAYLIINKIKRKFIDSSAHKRSMGEILFSFPAQWSFDEKRAYNMDRYKYLVRTLHDVGKAMGKPVAVFLQPVPAIGKTLTEREKEVVGDLSYRDTYLWMIDQLQPLNREDPYIFSLLDVFEGVTDTIYEDQFHFHRDPVTGESLGYRLVAKRIASILSAHWGLVGRCSE